MTATIAENTQGFVTDDQEWVSILGGFFEGVDEFGWINIHSEVLASSDNKRLKFFYQSWDTRFENDKPEPRVAIIDYNPFQKDYVIKTIQDYINSKYLEMQIQRYTNWQYAPDHDYDEDKEQKIKTDLALLKDFLTLGYEVGVKKHPNTTGFHSDHFYFRLDHIFENVDVDIEYLFRFGNGNLYQEFITFFGDQEKPTPFEMFTAMVRWYLKAYLGTYSGIFGYFIDNYEMTLDANTSSIVFKEKELSASV